MTPEEFKKALAFGLENLERVKGDVLRFHASQALVGLSPYRH